MIFLDNTSNLVVDAILTDEGRRQLANGTWNPVYYAFGDDDINYGNRINGDAQPNQALLQTPIMEGMTDNFSAQQHLLMTLNNNAPGYLYLPTLSTVGSGYGGAPTATGTVNGNFYVLLSTTAAVNKYAQGALPTGFQKADTDGGIANDPMGTTGITLDIGFKTNEVNGIKRTDVPPGELKETAFMVQMDSKYLRLFIPNSGQDIVTGGSKVSTALKAPSLGLDDDDIESYLLTYVFDPLNPSGQRFFSPVGVNTPSPNQGAPTGPRTMLRCAPSELLRTSQNAWTSGKYPVKTLDSFFDDGSSAYAIDTVVKMSGMDTGAMNTMYVRIIKEV